MPLLAEALVHLIVAGVFIAAGLAILTRSANREP